MEDTTNKQSFKELGKNTIVFAIASFATKLISFLLVPFYTNVLSTSEYGTIEILLNLSNLLVPIISLSISEAILRFGLDARVNKGSLLKNVSVVLSAAFIVQAILTPFLFYYRGIGEWNVLFGIICALQMLRSCLSIYLKAINKTKLFAIDSIIYALVLAVSNIFLIASAGLGIKGYLFSFIIAEALSILIIIIFGRIPKFLFQGKLDFSLLSQMLRYSIPLIVSSLAWWIITFSDKFMLELYIDKSAVGIYSVATKIPTLLSTVLSIFIQAWNLTSVKVYDAEKDSSNFYRLTFKFYMLVLVFSGWLIFTIIEPFMSVFVGKDFSSSYTYVPLLILSTIFLTIAWFFGPIYNAKKKSLSATITVLVSAVLNIVINILLIPIMGIMGAVYGTLSAYFVLALIRIVNTRKMIKFELNLIKNIPSVLLLVVFAFICTYACSIVKYITSSVVFLILIIVNHRVIFDFIITCRNIINHLRKSTR